jgi:hypothetical protein
VLDLEDDGEAAFHFGAGSLAAGDQPLSKLVDHLLEARSTWSIGWTEGAIFASLNVEAKNP